MTIDPYQPCFCGSNKKIKFCCSKDITSELDKIQNAINSDQRIAAVDQIDRLISSKGERDCLLVLKTNLLAQASRFDEARVLIDKLLERNPENPLVLSQAALLAIQQELDVDEAVVLLQNAFDAVQEAVPTVMVEVVRMVGIALLYSENYIAGRTHLSIYLNLAEETDPEMFLALMRSKALPNLSLLLKEDYELEPAGEGVEWAAEMEAIQDLANRARFRSGIERLRELEAKFPLEPVIRRNIAVLESRLGDIPAMVDAWRTYAQNEAVDLESAVEAEALAQLLDDDPDRDFVEQVVATITIKDASTALEKMQSSDRFKSINRPIPPSEDGSPPPKAVFMFLDRPELPDDANPKVDEIPEVIAELLVYGKQTDREARLACILSRDEEYDDVINAIREQLADSAGEIESEDVLGKQTQQALALTWQWDLPDSMTRETYQELVFEKQRQVMMEDWPDVPLDVLDGKTAREAAADPNYEIPLLAAVLLLEESADARILERIDLNQLRRELGLSTLETIDPASTDVQRLPLVRLHRVDAQKLDDEHLVWLAQEAHVNALLRVLGPVLRELIGRESISNEQFDKSRAYASLARIVESDDGAMEMIRKAQKIVVDRGEDPGMLLVRELELRFERQIMDGLEALLQTIQMQYQQNPQVMREVMRVYSRFGLMPSPEQQAEAMGAGPPDSGLWTPGSSASAAPASSMPPTAAEPQQPPASEGGSKLWLPGMD